jgi:hypothetical protein
MKNIQPEQNNPKEYVVIFLKTFALLILVPYVLSAIIDNHRFRKDYNKLKQDILCLHKTDSFLMDNDKTILENIIQIKNEANKNIKSTNKNFDYLFEIAKDN